jgi:hypothetical protein
VTAPGAALPQSTFEGTARNFGVDVLGALDIAEHIECW